MDARTPVIVAARRSPMGRRGGGLAQMHPAELLAHVQSAALESIGVEPVDVDLVMSGAVTKTGEQAYNIGRVGLLTGGWPSTVPGVTLDAQCGSSQQAVNLAAAQIRSGEADVIVASGVESMSRVPLGSDRDAGDPLSAEYRRQHEVVGAGESAELIADRWSITRAECDQFAWRSHQLAIASRELLADEIVPVVHPDGTVVERDELIRDNSIENLEALKAVFREDGYHTAASSSPITDGAAAVVVMSAEAAERAGLRPLASIMAQTIVGVDPTLRLTGPIPATRRLLDRSRLSFEDIDLFEINEAFSSVVLAWQREFPVDDSRLNRNGGALALGHPVGATGARLMTTAVHDLVRTGDRYALIAMCCGGGLGTGTIIKRWD